MKMEYIRNINASHMVIQQNGELKAWERDMLRHNDVGGILIAESTSENGTAQLWYDITGKQALDVWLETENLNYELLCRILSAIRDAAQRLETLLLKTDDLLVTPETVFVDFRTGTIHLCYYPGNEENLKEAFGRFMEYLLTRVDHKDEDAVKLIYDLYGQTREESYSLFSVFQEMRMPYPKEETETEEKAECSAEEEYRENDVGIQKTEATGRLELRGIFMAWAKRLRKLFFKAAAFRQQETEKPFVFTPEKDAERQTHPTILLSELATTTEGILQYEGQGAGKDFVLDSFPYLIGSDASCEGYIASETVSRKHARITRKDDIYFIEDLNSSNGTSVGGEILNYRVKMSLKKNDIVLFADEKFRFI